VAIIAHTISGSSKYRYDNVAAIPARPVAIVFGAFVYKHTLSPILQDRVDGGIALYKEKRVGKLIMTGDNSTKRYDEVTAMRDYAVAEGVPAKDVVLDYAGFDTFDSCYRAKYIFGVTSAILVTQKYHDARAVTIARALGIDAVGLDLPDWSKYPGQAVSFTVREYAADIKAWWMLYVSHSRSKFLGPRVVI
jgi:vancomycin permeability regulator SanA